MRISNEVILSYIDCKYKAYLLLSGAKVMPSKYEAFMDEHLSTYTKEALASINNKGNEQICEGIQIECKGDLNPEYDYLLNVTLRHKQFEIKYDVLKKETYQKSLSDESFVPLFFVTEESIREKHKLQAAILEFFICEVQGSQTEKVIIVHGKEQKKRTIKTVNYRNRIRQILNDIVGMHEDGVTQSLFICDYCRACGFHEKCFREAVDKDNLSLIGGLKEKEIEKLNNKGIFTINQLSYTFRPRRRAKRKKPTYKKRPFFPALKALSIREQKIHVLDTPDIPSDRTEIYFDIEGLPSESFYYLIGVVVIDGRKKSEYNFWADSKEDEINIFHQFFEILKGYDSYALFHYGAYDTKALKKIKKRLDGEYVNIADRAINSCTNLLTFIHSNVYLPIYSNGLKDIGEYLVYKWSVPESSGLMSIVWRKKWESTGNDTYKEKLIIYNRDDCYALLEVKKLLDTFDKSITDKKVDTSNIIHVDTMPRPSLFKFMTNEFAFPEIKTLRNAAYFDYDLMKVKLGDRKAISPKRNKTIHKNKPNKTIAIEVARCPHCNGYKITKDKPAQKNMYDLRFFNHGVKRWTIKYQSYYYKCKICKSHFTPTEYKNIESHFGHSFKSWIVYQNIANRLSMRQIRNNVDELFRMTISHTSVHKFKFDMSEYYNVTYEQIIRDIIISNILYIDETPVKMIDEEGYIWVLTDTTSVISIYQPTREGEFINDLLKNYSGIIVTDFYNVYDQIDCLQQKCLIHIIRDINDDVVENPYDEEFSGIAKAFTILLNSIVSTIDKYGLKKRNLNKHKMDVEKFYKNYVSKYYRSEVARKYCKRFNKYKSKLFLFLEHDDLCWHNNYAEHAIKLIGLHYDYHSKWFNSKNIQSHLILTSLYQTCKYRNISFLDFLLSGEKDIDKFCLTRRYKRTR